MPGWTPGWTLDDPWMKSPFHFFATFRRHFVPKAGFGVPSRTPKIDKKHEKRVSKNEVDHRRAPGPPQGAQRAPKKLPSHPTLWFLMIFEMMFSGLLIDFRTMFWRKHFMFWHVLEMVLKRLGRAWDRVLLRFDHLPTHFDARMQARILNGFCMDLRTMFWSDGSGPMLHITIDWATRAKGARWRGWPKASG